MHYALFYDVVEDFTTKRTQFRGLHLGQVQAAVERGELVMAGALTEPADGALLIFRGESPEAAVAFAKADPYVTNGLVKAWRVRKWMTVVGDGAEMPTV
jgi:uncharacterized protein YciI